MSTDGESSSMGGGAGGQEPGPSDAPDADVPIDVGAPQAEGEATAGAPTAEVSARRVRHDPWAHRRAEPRTFAFIWTLYLFLATLSTYAMAMSSGVGGHDVIRPAARMLLALVAAGIVVIWPMVRLSQMPDPRPVAGPILDTVVVLVPIQAIVWPQYAWWLAAWPLSVVGAVAVSMTCWAALVGGVISIIHTRRSRGSRRPALWMAMILAVVMALHIPAAVSAGLAPAGPDAPTHRVRATWMLSPVLSVFEMTQDRTWIGTPAVVSGGHWRMLGLTGGLALGVWLVAGAMADAGRRRGSGLH